MASMKRIMELLKFIGRTTRFKKTSDVQGFSNPPRVRGRGQEGKGQGKDFMTLNKLLTLLKGFSGVFLSLISRYSKCFMPIKLSLNNVASEKRLSKEASLPLQDLVLFTIC